MKHPRRQRPENRCGEGSRYIEFFFSRDDPRVPLTSFEITSQSVRCTPYCMHLCHLVCISLRSIMHPWDLEHEGNNTVRPDGLIQQRERDNRARKRSERGSKACAFLESKIEALGHTTDACSFEPDVRYSFPTHTHRENWESVRAQQFAGRGSGGRAGLGRGTTTHTRIHTHEEKKPKQQTTLYSV